jgi:hypothetical protein
MLEEVRIMNLLKALKQNNNARNSLLNIGHSFLTSKKLIC